MGKVDDERLARAIETGRHTRDLQSAKRRNQKCPECHSWTVHLDEYFRRRRCSICGWFAAAQMPPEPSVTEWLEAIEVRLAALEGANDG